MMEVVTGGSGSGKSAYAEQKICGLQQGTGRLYYIATMYPYGSETERKIERHRWMRGGKGFRTLEWYTGLSECIEKEFSGQEGAERLSESAILLECMSNLVANEMFSGADIISEDVVVGHILQGIKNLSTKVDELVIVSNNVFEDGISYDATTQAYIRALGRINTGVAALADTVTEVVVGIPVPVKERKEAGYAHH